MNQRHILRWGLVIICLTIVLVFSSAIGPTPALAFPANDYVTGCTGQYYNNMTLAGSPVLVRTDPAINFYWPEGTSPGPGVNTSQYSVSWTCSVNVATAGTYTFILRTDDGMNLLIDGNLILWAWYDQGPSTYAKAVYAQRRHPYDTRPVLQ
jgi:hypothetical protein